MACDRRLADRHTKTPATQGSLGPPAEGTARVLPADDFNHAADHRRQLPPPPLGMDEKQPGMVQRSHYTKSYRPNRDGPLLTTPPAHQLATSCAAFRSADGAVVHTDGDTRRWSTGIGYAGSPTLRCLPWEAKNSDHESTSGCCLRNARRWRSVMPPRHRTPSGCQARQRGTVTTGQCRQMTAAFLCAAPRTNNSSGSVERHRAHDTHAMRASAAELMNSVIWTMVLARAGGD